MPMKIIRPIFYLLTAIHVVSCTHKGSAGRACIVAKSVPPYVIVNAGESQVATTQETVDSCGSQADYVQPETDSAEHVADMVLDAMESRNRSSSRSRAESRQDSAAVAHHDRAKFGPRIPDRGHRAHHSAGIFQRRAGSFHHPAGHSPRAAGRASYVTSLFGYDEESANAALYASAVQRSGEMPADLAKLEITETMAGKIWGKLDSRENLERVKVLAEKHPNACFLLGIAYEDGLIVQKSWRAATTWYERALANKYELAREHYAESAYQVALLCRDDKEERASWYKKSAEAGHKEAMCAWGICLWRGRGVVPNPFEAVSMFRQSARMGCRDAQFMLGLAYWEGRGVLRNYPKAVAFFTQTKDQGDVLSLYYLGRAHERGLGTPQNAEQAEKYYQMAAENGHAGASCALGNLYYSGRIAGAKQEDAVKWYKMAAENNNREALHRLVSIYTNGCSGISPNAALAAVYRQRLRSNRR